MRIFVMLSFLQLFYFRNIIARRLSEDERIQQWRERNTWPPQWQEESEGYRANQARREKEIMQLTGAQERWENWMQFTQGQMVPKFTEKGFELVKAPEQVYKLLREAVDEGMQNWDNLPYEDAGDGIFGDLRPKFIDIGRIAWHIADMLKEYHEQWSGLELEATSSYGVRLYQNGSSLVMHHDKVR
jgi:hypothetical protein